MNRMEIQDRLCEMGYHWGENTYLDGSSYVVLIDKFGNCGTGCRGLDSNDAWQKVWNEVQLKQARKVWFFYRSDNHSIDRLSLYTKEEAAAYIVETFGEDSHLIEVDPLGIIKGFEK